MGDTYESFLERWEGHVEELVNVSAKKGHAIEAKHRQIVDGACSVFFQKGYHPTSIREIAQAAGMSLGQLYHYISSKDDVLFLIHKHMQTSWYRQLTDSRIENVKDPLERLALAVRTTFDFLVKNKDLIQFIYSESKYLNKEHLQVVLEMDDKNVVEFWREILRDCFKDRKPAPDIDLAANFIAYILVFYALRGWNLKSRPVKEVAEFVLDFIYKGLGLSR